LVHFPFIYIREPQQQKTEEGRKALNVIGIEILDVGLDDWMSENLANKGQLIKALSLNK
jgi:hypothetical protein